MSTSLFLDPAGLQHYDEKIKDFVATMVDTSTNKATEELTESMEELVDVTMNSASLTIYIRAEGSDANDGRTEETAVKTIERAMDILNDFPNSKIVFNFGAGEFSHSEHLSFDNKTIWFVGVSSSETTIKASMSFDTCVVSFYMISVEYTGTEHTEALMFREYSHVKVVNSAITTSATYCIQCDSATALSADVLQLNGTYGIRAIGGCELYLRRVTDNCSNICLRATCKVYITTDNGQYPITYQTYSGVGQYPMFIDGVSIAVQSMFDDSKVLYVDSVNGSDSNIGTSTSPMQTLDYAISIAKRYKSCIINLAAGTHTISSGSVSFRGSISLSIRGESASTTTIEGNISFGRGAYVSIQGVTIKKVDGLADTSSVYVWEEGAAYIAGTIIDAGSAAYSSIRCSNGAEINCVESYFNGNPMNTIMIEKIGDVTCRNCTDNTGATSVCDAGNLSLHNTTMLYESVNGGIVYIDGVQMAPKDMRDEAIIKLIKQDIMPCFSVAQGSTPTGAYMLVAELEVPAVDNQEFYIGEFSVRNRVVDTTSERGTLLVRLRYNKVTSKFIVAQAIWESGSKVTTANWYLATNDGTRVARIYVKCDAAYTGYTGRLLDASSHTKTSDFSMWNVYSQTSGDAELPISTDGWVIIASTVESD